MINKDTMIEVTNRFSGSIGYDVPDLGITRHYESNETKLVSFEELLKLSYSIGGMNLLKDYLIIHNQEAVESLLGDVEPEYYYTQKEVQTLLEQGSLEQLEDCLDFAEEGVIDLVKKTAVDLKINDLSKRKIILDKTGFDVDAAIKINELDHEDDEVIEKETPNRRRSTPITVKEESPKRKTNPPKYKVTSIL